MSWYRQAKVGLSQKELNVRLKKIVRESSFFQKLFEQYDVPMDKIDDELTFQAKKLHGRYAQGNGKFIFLNEKLFEDGRFFDERIHFVVHEMTHWLTRQREKQFYFSDPEEIDAFIFGMAYEIIRGKSELDIAKVFFPIIEDHFQKQQNAEELFHVLFSKAERVAKSLG